MTSLNSRRQPDIQRLAPRRSSPLPRLIFFSKIWHSNIGEKKWSENNDIDTNTNIGTNTNRQTPSAFQQIKKIQKSFFSEFLPFSDKIDIWEYQNWKYLVGLTLEVKLLLECCKSLILRQLLPDCPPPLGPHYISIAIFSTNIPWQSARAQSASKVVLSYNALITIAPLWIQSGRNQSGWMN